MSVFQPTPPPVTLPTPASITLPYPLSYEFRVVEWMKDGKVEKVGLQVKCNQHDQFGQVFVTGQWQDVPREQINME